MGARDARASGRAEEAAGLRAELERARKEAKKPAKSTEAEFEIVRQGKQGDVEVLVVEVRSGDPLEVSDRLKQQFAPAAVIDRSIKAQARRSAEVHDAAVCQLPVIIVGYVRP